MGPCAWLGQSRLNQKILYLYYVVFINTTRPCPSKLSKLMSEVMKEVLVQWSSRRLRYNKIKGSVFLRNLEASISEL